MEAPPLPTQCPVLRPHESHQLAVVPAAVPAAGFNRGWTCETNIGLPEETRAGRGGEGRGWERRTLYEHFVELEGNRVGRQGVFALANT